MQEKLDIYSVLKLPKDFPVKEEKLFKNKKIVVISPHSDDMSICCGGFISALSKNNIIIPVLFFSGHRGVQGKQKEQATKIREQEMKREAKILKTKPPVYLSLASYTKDNLMILEEDIIKLENFLIAQNPDIVFLPKKDDLHPRHKLATLLFFKALETPFLEREEKKEPTTLFFYENPWSLFNPYEFNTAFIFSKKEMQHKLKALRVHQSQTRRTPFERATESLAKFRGSVVLEQRVFGYGKNTKVADNYFMETFLVYENYNKREL